MDRFEKPLERRKFLKKGIMGSVFLIALPPEKALRSDASHYETNSLKRGIFPACSANKLLRIVRKYGGEFGVFKGGL
ncbi:MAG: hypothetical protein JSV17_15140 [Candidatus Aminicenantes bacterium]|nr:MAG: hypothetical protein JSV17_15140 [Candidatus Aminicenantes bacterium]